LFIFSKGAAMNFSRRSFLAASALAGTGIALSASRAAESKVTKADLDRILDQPVLKTGFLDRPVIVESVELLKSGRNYLLRTRSTDGVEAITAPNPERMSQCWPIFLKDIVPVFVKHDARQLQSLIWDLYRHNSNYKLQGIALWTGCAAIEMGLLELLGQTAKRPVAELFGGKLKSDIAIYYASGVRGSKPEEEIVYLQKLVGSSGAKAIKFRLGGRMNKNVDSLPGRTEALIPLVRKTFGDKMTLYADSNSSYDTKEAIRIGRIMEAHNFAFYEEPCEFDDVWSTKEVADALTIPVAGGEQEYSMHRWQWAIANRGLDIVQPDLARCGGFTHRGFIGQRHPIRKREHIRAPEHDRAGGAGRRTPSWSARAAALSRFVARHSPGELAYVWNRVIADLSGTSAGSGASALSAQQRALHVELMGRGMAWLDTGTPDALLQAANFIQALQERQGLKIACLEEIAWVNKWIDAATLDKQIKRLGSTSYAEYLRRLQEESRVIQGS
jgi:L-alanine-DL-glutamate epimerase-like enolase superfamily enzyme